MLYLIVKMAENIPHPLAENCTSLKDSGIHRTRAPLGIIYDNNIKYDITRGKLPNKSKKEREFTSSIKVGNFEIFADENECETVVTEEEEDPLQDYLDEINRKIFSQDIKSILISPEVVEEPEHEKDSPAVVPAWCAPYKQDIYSYFRKIERNFRPNANYMEKQSDITLNMRSVLVDWLVEVAEEYKLNTETFYLTVSYVDRFLSRMAVTREKLQLVGTASMFIASKYEEIYPPELKDFVYITDDTYNKKQILHMEHLILKALNFDISVPTAYSFLQIYCSMCTASEKIMYLSQYICEFSLLDADVFLKFLPSITAAGSLALANYILGYGMWDEALVASTGYYLKELIDIISCLYNKCVSMSTCPQQAIFEKYKAPKYKCVSTIPVPKELIFLNSCTM